MNLIINGKPQEHQETTLGDLLSALQLDVARVAVEVNHEIVPRHAFATTLLQENDKLEIVQFVGGG